MPEPDADFEECSYLRSRIRQTWKRLQIEANLNAV